ncbi:MAG TPA: FAD/NAD(P)-binding oxidoreductase [Methylophilaceae bacterium]|jgi:NADH dehydrogenase FAD-containing subunit
MDNDSRNNNAKLSRRDFFKLSGAVAAAGAGAAVMPTSAAAAALISGRDNMAKLPKPKGPRLVIVGAGTSGLTIAKYAKINYPSFDVVMVEKRDMYASCFSSNLLYADLIDLEFLADHSFLDAARNGKYIFFNATCTGLDRANRRLATDQGEIAYDYLVLAPGIDYDYSRINVNDIDTETALRRDYPAGWTKPTEHISIRNKVRDFKGGVFIQTVPSGNYRCLPSPYERACMIASYFKKHSIKGKVVILDSNPDITIKAEGFHAAFNELYKDYIEYNPSVDIKGVDVSKKLIHTAFDSYAFDDAAIYPGIRASRLIEDFGLLSPSSTQKEANIDIRKYNIIGDERVYVTGDARPMGYSKSANTANTEGKYVAKVLAAHAQGKTVEWESPRTLCFSMVNADPIEAISVDANYTYFPEKHAFGFSNTTKMDQHRDQEKGGATLSWAQSLYADLFS